MSRLHLAAVAAMLSCALMLGVTATAGAQTAPTQDAAKRVAVTGTAKNGKKFRGTYTINRFVSRGGKVFAVGTLKGRLKHRHVTRRGVRIPVTGFTGPAGAQSSQLVCNVLTLTLGPLDLNLLGLVVHLDRVVLDITAQQGPGNLLGNLLCAITGILDGGLPMNLVAQILNTILGILQL
jgi:hypothetical protein